MGGSVTLSRDAHSQVCTSNAAYYFVEVLTILWRDTAAVTIHPQHGEPFGDLRVHQVGHVPFPGSKITGLWADPEAEWFMLMPGQRKPSLRSRSPASTSLADEIVIWKHSP